MARKFRTKVIAPGFVATGFLKTPGTTEVTVLAEHGGYVTACEGATVPSDGEAGFAKGCFFFKTNGSAGTIFYFNEGSNTSCAFNPVKTPESDPSFSGDVTMGDAPTDTLILNSRLATGSVAGAALSLGASYTRGEGVEMRYTVTDWTGIGGQFQAMYWRAQSDADAVATLRGGEVYAVANASGVTALEGLNTYAYIKGDTTETIANAYGIHGEFTMDAGRANSITLTEAAGVLSKILSGKVADYTKIHGFVGRFGDMDGGSRKYGSGLRLLDGAESGTSSLSEVVYTDMAADYFLVVSAADKGAVDDTIAGQTVGTINAVVKCKFASTDFYLYGYATAPSS